MSLPHDNDTIEFTDADYARAAATDLADLVEVATAEATELADTIDSYTATVERQGEYIAFLEQGLEFLVSQGTAAISGVGLAVVRATRLDDEGIKAAAAAAAGAAARFRAMAVAVINGADPAEVAEVAAERQAAAVRKKGPKLVAVDGRELSSDGPAEPATLIVPKGRELPGQ